MNAYEPFHENANIVDLDQLRHVAQANPQRRLSPPVEFLFQESLLYSYYPLRRNVSADPGRYITQSP